MKARSGRRHGHEGRGQGRGARLLSEARGAELYGNDAALLSSLRAGDEVEILAVDDEDARVHSLRFGMAEGSRATCVTRIPAGPIIMRSGRQEIAVGRGLAHRIHVRKIGDSRKAG